MQLDDVKALVEWKLYVCSVPTSQRRVCVVADEEPKLPARDLCQVCAQAIAGSDGYPGNMASSARP